MKNRYINFKYTEEEQNRMTGFLSPERQEEFNKANKEYIAQSLKQYKFSQNLQRIFFLALGFCVSYLIYYIL
ncbi:MAG: hypothetical protein IPO06_29595 [Leptospiraceae bacterium]|nr:hypothetical protein [Leptospiraceae bacterium]MBP6738360.1 hypothetical protein [Leptospiraceae bacterium]